MLKRILLTITWPALILIALTTTGMAAPPVSVQIEPNLVSIGAMYNGAEVVATGEIPSDAQVIVQVTGDREDIVLSEKGKAFGLLWMNTGEVTLYGAPTVYMLYLSETDSSKGSGNAHWRDVGVGFESLRKQITLKSSNGKADLDFDEFLKLKQKEGLYAIHKDALIYGKEEGAIRPFSCKMFMPPRMHQGTYEVTAIVIEDGKVLKKVTEQLKIKRAGLTQFMTRLALNHGTLYGVMACLVALMAGLFMGLVFKGGKGAH
ncbi:MAG TPA: TIGR02186 family protein [Desulfobacteria bacterium]|nr:TIGR02186 family protein [Desulfobacteria bacterium]